MEIERLSRRQEISVRQFDHFDPAAEDERNVIESTLEKARTYCHITRISLGLVVSETCNVDYATAPREELARASLRKTKRKAAI